jgi:protein regulator of cytokinesis 1
VEQDLLNLLPVWEEANGRPFMVQGERVVDKIHDALEAKEMAKEAKKVS